MGFYIKRKQKACLPPFERVLVHIVNTSLTSLISSIFSPFWKISINQLLLCTRAIETMFYSKSNFGNLDTSVYSQCSAKLCQIDTKYRFKQVDTNNSGRIKASDKKESHCLCLVCSINLFEPHECFVYKEKRKWNFFGAYDCFVFKGQGGNGPARCIAKGWRVIFVGK